MRAWYVVVIAMVGCVPQHAAPVGLREVGRATKGYDRFTGTWKYLVRPDWQRMRDGELPIVLVAASKDEIPRGALFGAASISERWRYLRCHDLSVIYDGVRITGRPSHHEGGVASSGAVSEQIYIPITMVELRGMAQAQAIEFKLCNSVRQLTLDDMRLLREFAALIPTGTPTSAPTAEK